MSIRHVYPLNDLEEHDTESAGQCDCNPTVEFVNGDTIVIHNSYDGREIIEQIEGGTK